MMHPRVQVAAVGLLGYLGLALSVGNLYPVSTFEMYAAAPARSASRVIARDAAGAAHEVDEYREWSCDAPVPLDRAPCASEWPYAYTGYLDRAAADWIASHPGSGGEPMEVVRRIFRLGAAGPPEVRDCVLSRCRAVRR
jgi:hypothetical protein